MFGCLSTVFRKNLVDSLDKTPTRKKTYARILSFLISSFFSYPHDEVANGCTTSMIEILEYTFPEMLDPNNSQALLDTFIDPLIKLLPGGAANDYQV